jgi:hypothetical protein
MVSWVAFLPVVGLLSAIFFIPLLCLYYALRSLRYSRLMHSLADEHSLHYTRPNVFRPPTVNGFYKGRSVVVDYVNGCMKIRSFHSGEVADEFTVGTEDDIRMMGVLGAMKLDF